jgi:hypothetical protein
MIHPNNPKVHQMIEKWDLYLSIQHQDLQLFYKRMQKTYYSPAKTNDWKRQRVIERILCNKMTKYK